VLAPKNLAWSSFGRRVLASSPSRARRRRRRGGRRWCWCCEPRRLRSRTLLFALATAFVGAVCLGLYIAFLFIETGWHRAFFLPVGAEAAEEQERPSGRIALASLGLLLVAVLSVVLAKSLDQRLETGVQAVGAPPKILGVILAAIVLFARVSGGDTRCGARPAAVYHQSCTRQRGGLDRAYCAGGCSRITQVWATARAWNIHGRQRADDPWLPCGNHHTAPDGPTCCPASSTWCCWQPTSSPSSPP
jgi:hypothetical protein